MTGFLKWLFLSTVYIVLSTVSEMKFGAISYLVNNDVSYICYALVILFWIGLLRAGYQAVTGATTFRLLEYMCELSTYLGLLGTIYGLIVVFKDGLTDASAIGQGISTAMTTTMAGVIVMIMLSVYPHLLGSNKE